MTDKTIYEEVEDRRAAEGDGTRADARLTIDDEQTREADKTATNGIELADVEAASESQRQARNRNLLIVAAVALILVVALFFIFRSRGTTNTAGRASDENTAADKTAGESAANSTETEPNEIALPPEAQATAGIEIAGVTVRPAVALLNVTGSVEANPQATQQVTPLVGGRVERVNIALGDRVRQGDVLATIASPQIAETRGNLQAAETRLGLAGRNLQRVQRAENRVAVLQAKAKLDEADATLRRTRRLVELGAGAGKDLIAAEAAYKSAKADYDFQSNIALNREVQEAQAAVETARTEVTQIRGSLNALGASADASGGNASLIVVRAPASGNVTERLINPGAGIDAGKPLFTIANLSTVYVIANVPEAQLGSVRVGTPAEVRAAALNQNAINGRVTYIDPQLNEETRTARVRIEVANTSERLKTGMFVEVGFQTGVAAGADELVVPNEAVQRIGERTVVFIPREDEPGHYEVRDVEVGGETAGYTRIKSGLRLGERVVTKGGFTLKSQLQKGSFGEDEK